jgi:hypothetical protein
MKKISSRTLNFYDKEIVEMIVEKYDFEEMEAIRQFISSETYKMLIDPELEVYKLSPLIVFDMWETERISGDPRRSQYIRSDL